MRQVDKFSNRLDEIFEDENPTKALIIDAYVKSNPNSQKQVKPCSMSDVRLSLPDSEIIEYCNNIEKQEAKLISKSKMVWYKAGIEQGLRAFPVLMRDNALQELEESDVKETLICGRFSISEHPPILENAANGSKEIWMETDEGEGTTIDVEKLFEWAQCNSLYGIMNNRIKYLEGLLPVHEYDIYEKYYQEFSLNLKYMSGGVYSWLGIVATSRREVWLMGVLFKEGIEYEQV